MLLLLLLLLLLDTRCHLVPLSTSVAMGFSVSLTNHSSVFISGEIPPYHYGTHYSSTMIVASYLIRLEPFTQHFLRVQVIVTYLFCFYSAILVGECLYQNGHFYYTATQPTYPRSPPERGKWSLRKRDVVAVI